MEHLLPLLENRFHALMVAFRFVVFAMLVAGLIIHMSRRHHGNADIVRPVARAITITGLVASAGWWFPLVENSLLATATYIDATYTAAPYRAAEKIRDAAKPNPAGKSWSWRKINESLYHAVTDAVSWIFIQVSTLFCVVMGYLQYMLRWILYMLTPFALGCFMIPALNGMAVRFFQQVLAVLAWPVGFALTNVIALAIWQDFSSMALENLTGPADAVYSPFLLSSGGILACLALLLGTTSTPVVCQMLFAHGYAFTGQTSSPVAVGRAASDFAGRADFASRMFSSPSHAALASAPPPPPAMHTPGL